MTEYTLNPADLSGAELQNKVWFARRDECLACKHCYQRTGTAGETILHCRETTGSGLRFGAYCIDAREHDQKCGPGATLFQPKEQP